MVQDGIQKGWFLGGAQMQGDAANMKVLVSAALGVATGCAYLHSCGIVHGGEPKKRGNISAGLLVVALLQQEWSLSPHPTSLHRAG